MAVLLAAVGLQLAVSGASLASERMDDGLKAYKASCADCHDNGEDGAPRTHEPQDWVNRSPLWDAIVLEHANKGYLTMPAKGGKPDMSNYDVDVAAEYMLNIAHPDLPRD